MVRALEEALDVAGTRVAQPRAAVPAHVVKGSQLACEIAAHDHRPSSDLDDKVITRLRDLVCDANRHPRLSEDLLALQREEALLRVGVRDQRRSEFNREARLPVGLLAHERVAWKGALHAGTGPSSAGRSSGWAAHWLTAAGVE